MENNLESKKSDAQNGEQFISFIQLLPISKKCEVAYYGH